jgi:hypothetical protein
MPKSEISKLLGGDSGLTDEQLLLEAEDLIRTKPTQLQYPSTQELEWLGRAGAIVQAWNPLEMAHFALFQNEAMNSFAQIGQSGENKLFALLYRMRTDLMFKTRGPLNAAVDRGMVFDYFDYFDGLRKVIELAQQDIFFIDPYLDADFVSRYLPHVKATASIRLMGRKSMSTLMPAVQAFSQQSGRSIEVRASSNLHDRYVLIDRRECYQSGASFKDGGRLAPTTLTQITDAFPAMLQTYEGLWSNATPQP